MSLSTEELQAIVYPEDQALVWGRFQDRLRGKPVPQRYELRVIRKNGSVCWIEVFSKCVDYDGKPAIQATFIDITERKRAEKALRESELQYRTTMDSMGDAMHVVDRDFRFLLFNNVFKRWNRELGLETDVIGLQIFDVFPFLPDRVRDEYERVFETGEILVTEESMEIGGKEFITETRKIPVFEGESATRVVTVIRDISERKRTEKALRDSEEKYCTLINQSRDAICLLYGGKFEIINKRFEKLFGYSQDETNAPDFDFMNLVAPKSRGSIEDRVQRVERGESVTPQYEYTAISRDGVEIEVETSVSYIQYKEGIATQGILRDITERVRAEESLRESEEFNFALFQYNPIETIVVDREGRMIKSNIKKRKAGVRLPDVWDVMYKDYAGKHEIDMHAEWMECIRADKTKRFPELKYGDKFLSVTIASFPKGAIITSQDITEREQLKIQLLQSEKMSALGQLIS